MGKKDKQPESASSDKCKHPNARWQEWKYVSGVTSGIQFRTKVCPRCGVVDSESREV